MSERFFSPDDPWTIVEPELRLDRLGETESIFALSNGHIGLRGNLEEGEPHGIPGTYLNGVYEEIPLPHAEEAYGYPEVGQSLINVTDGKLVRLLVDDEPFDVRMGTLDHHRRELDLRDGVLRRDVAWTSPAGQAVRVRSTRLVSFVQRAVAAIDYEVEAVGAPARITVQSSLVANEPIPVDADDPRAAAALRAPLVGEQHAAERMRVVLGHHTHRSGLRVVAGLDHAVSGPPGTVTTCDSEPDLARVTVSTELRPGQVLRVVKVMAYGWSSVRSMPALRDQVEAALVAAMRTGWDGLRRSQREFLDDLWDRADVEVDGDPELQQALRYAVFQVHQAAARSERRPVPAKGLTGRGYDGHTFWDMDAYTVPVLTYTAPSAAADCIRWRHDTLNAARARAHELRLGGAAFPWRTIRGDECSGYWPAGTAAFHISANVAEAVRRYLAATDDEELARGEGLELLVETARLWWSLGHFDTTGRFRIDGVTGPDEYTALVDNNVFTNLMAARNLTTAALAVRAHPEEAARLGADEEEARSWEEAAEVVAVPFDHELGVTSQSEGFTRYRAWDFEGTPDDHYPLLLHYPYYLLYSSQVVKQADLVFALYVCGDSFTPEQKRKDFEHYEAITVRDSSLSPSIQAVVAAEVGHLDLAYAYLRETALIDLRNLAGNADDGLHIASLAGAWLAVVAGFGGMRDHPGGFCFNPRLPSALSRIRFVLQYRGRHLAVEITPGEARYRLLAGEPLELAHHGEPLTVTTGEDAVAPCPAPPEVAGVSPPTRRDPGIRGAGRERGGLSHSGMTID